MNCLILNSPKHYWPMPILPVITCLMLQWVCVVINDMWPTFLYSTLI